MACEHAAPWRPSTFLAAYTEDRAEVDEILNQNPNGVVCFRDEIIGLLKSLEKQGQEGARAFYLEAWDGTGCFTYDRIGRGTIDIECAIVSVIGSIQPGPLGQYLRAVLANGTGNDGLMQRFQLAVWPDVSTAWRNVDRWPDSAARQTAFDTYLRLDQLDGQSVGATTDQFDPDGVPFLRFDDQAQEVFKTWRTSLERQLRRGDEHPAMVAHLAKYRSLLPSLALLIHLAEGRTARVPLSAITRAVAWTAYLESHARRIFGAAITADIAAARGLAHRLLKEELPSCFSLRDVYHKGWTGLSTREEVVAAVDLLSDFQWLFTTIESTTGRPRTRCWVNPKIKSLGPTPTHKTSKTVKSPLRPPLLEVLEAGSKPNGAEIMEGEEEDSTEPLSHQTNYMDQVGCPDGEQPPDDVRYANVPELEADNWGDL